MSAKRLTAKGEATRHRIVVAAAQLMYEQGISDTTMEDMRAATGASSSQIYHYFADKQALLLAVIDYQTGAVLDLQAPHLDHLDTISGLRAWRDLLVGNQKRLQCRGGCPIGTLGSQTAETNPEARLAVASGYLRWENAIRAGLTAMYSRGNLNGNPDDLALALLTALQGGLLMTKIHRDVRPLEVALDTVLDRISSLSRTLPAVTTNRGRGGRTDRRLSAASTLIEQTFTSG
ncbi:TetR family transcriptional regulator [Actinoplanes sp. Pm04-4]|uniref:TetR family transcriptional regulator n=1 Tax=Paractinoplanes pyxinae TaxID=2997416 RepID=A0ABT4BGT8_9ACTN|nr:TetR/AcrR family transcriptional regulator [Actinoplanes pyxinae]MCY1145754.1 TetR family transcriptional regulator [Actinoplanes pyxinae]